MPADAAALDRLFRALADPSRRSIVVQLSEGPASVSDLAAPLRMSLPAVVQHIDVLQKSGIVSSEKVGRVRTCSLQPEPMAEVERWIAEHRRIWEGRLDRLGDVLNTTYQERNMSVVHSEFTIERHYDFTPAQTFGAFADPELKGQWFAVPEHFENRAWELDFRIGGGELNRGTVPGGPTYTFKSRFHEIITDERIVFAYDMHVNEKLMSVSLTTVQFLPADNATRLLFTEQGAFFDGLDEPAAREHGTGEFLTALGTFLTTELLA